VVDDEGQSPQLGADLQALLFASHGLVERPTGLSHLIQALGERPPHALSVVEDSNVSPRRQDGHSDAPLGPSSPDAQQVTGVRRRRNDARSPMRPDAVVASDGAIQRGLGDLATVAQGSRRSWKVFIA
jgi:hypothetical protein